MGLRDNIKPFKTSNELINVSLLDIKEYLHQMELIRLKQIFNKKKNVKQ